MLGGGEAPFAGQTRLVRVDEREGAGEGVVDAQQAAQRHAVGRTGNAVHCQ